MDIESIVYAGVLIALSVVGHLYLKKKKREWEDEDPDGFGWHPKKDDE